MFKKVMIFAGVLALVAVVMTMVTLSNETALAASETTHYDAGPVGTVSEVDTFLAVVTGVMTSQEPQVRWVSYSDGAYTVTGGECQVPAFQQWKDQYSRNVGDTVTPTHRLTASAEAYTAPGWWAGHHLYNSPTRGLVIYGKNAGPSSYLSVTEATFDLSLRFANAADVTCAATSSPDPAPTATSGGSKPTLTYSVDKAAYVEGTDSSITFTMTMDPPPAAGTSVTFEMKIIETGRFLETWWENVHLTIDDTGTVSTTRTIVDDSADEDDGIVYFSQRYDQPDYNETEWYVSVNVRDNDGGGKPTLTYSTDKSAYVEGTDASITFTMTMDPPSAAGTSVTFERKIIETGAFLETRWENFNLTIDDTGTVSTTRTIVDDSADENDSIVYFSQRYDQPDYNETDWYVWANVGDDDATTTPPPPTPEPPPTRTPVPYVPSSSYTEPALDTSRPSCTDAEALWRAGVLEVTAGSSADTIETDYYAAYAGTGQSGVVRIHEEGRVCAGRNTSGPTTLQSIAASQATDSGVDSSRIIEVEADRGFRVRNHYDSPGLHISGDSDPYVGKFYYADLIQEAENYRNEVYRVTEVYADEWHSDAAALNANRTSANNRLQYGYGQKGSAAPDAAGDDMKRVADTTSGLYTLVSPIIQYFGDATVWHWYNSSNGKFWMVEYLGIEPADVHNGRLPDTAVAPASIPAAPPLKTAGTYAFTQVQVDATGCSGWDIDAVKDATQTPTGVDGGKVTAIITEDSRLSALMSVANALTTFTINPGSRFIDTDGEVYNCDWESDVYWRIVKTSDATTPALDPVTVTYTVEHVRVDGDRSSAQAVRDATKTATGVDSGSHSVTLIGDHTTADILTAADARSTHSITTGSRYIDADGAVHNFQSGKRTYWLITEATDETVTPVVSTAYMVEHVRVDGDRSSAQAVRDATKTATGVGSGSHSVTLIGDHTTADILTAADARSTHSITTGSRYIDADGAVHNFQSGKRTYWLITKQ